MGKSGTLVENEIPIKAKIPIHAAMGKHWMGKRRIQLNWTLSPLLLCAGAADQVLGLFGL